MQYDIQNIFYYVPIKINNFNKTIYIYYMYVYLVSILEYIYFSL